jgi:hypothetical protein
MPGVVGLLLIYLVSYKKTVVADASGIASHLNMVVYRTVNRREFTEFAALTVRRRPDGNVALGFIREGMTTTLAFTPDDAATVRHWAVQANPGLAVRDV